MISPIIKKFLWLGPVLLLLVSCQTQQTPTIVSGGGDTVSIHAFDAKLSTNWLAAVQAVLPTNVLAETNLNFQVLTNSLRRESQHGNNAAKGLWGMTVLALAQSAEMTRAGLGLLRSSAAAGDVPTMTRLGFIYQEGKYLRKNYNEAFHWFNLAADKGDPVAQLQLGGCYQYGLGTTPDLALAAKYYRRSAEQTNYVAMKSLGYLLMNGLGTDKDLVAAKQWLTRAAEEGGNRRAMFNLGSLYLLGFPETNATAQAFQWYRKSAELGDDLACFQLANFYYRGWGVVATNLASYHYWRLKAATLGATEAQYDMGTAYRIGDGVPVDMETALVWYRKAAAKNDPRAYYDLALHYLADKTNRASLLLANRYMLLAAKGGHREAQFQCALNCFRGDLAPVDVEGGKQWLAQSAEAGWPKAEFCLFQLYYNGVALGPLSSVYRQDKAAGIKWLRRAAEHESFPAQSSLAIMLISGLDMAQDKVAAEKLLRHAAEHGYAQSQADLGFAIENGDTSSRDMVESAMWSQLAIAHITDPNILSRAKINLANAQSHLTVEQRMEVNQRVKNFQALPVAPQDPMSAGWEINTAYQREDGKYGH